jgi:hypothetical protein
MHLVVIAPGHDVPVPLSGFRVWLVGNKDATHTHHLAEVEHEMAAGHGAALDGVRQGKRTHCINVGSCLIAQVNGALRQL